VQFLYYYSKIFKMNASNKQIHTLLFDQLTNVDYPAAPLIHTKC